MFIVFLCEEIVYFNEKCVVKQLTIETTFKFRVSMGLGEEAAHHGLSWPRCRPGAAQHQHPSPPWDGAVASGKGGESCSSQHSPTGEMPWWWIHPPGTASARAVPWTRLTRAPAGPWAHSAAPFAAVFRGKAMNPLAGRPRELGSDGTAGGKLWFLGAAVPSSAGAQGACFDLRNSLTFQDVHLDVVCGLNITYDHCSSHCFQLNLAC